MKNDKKKKIKRYKQCIVCDEDFVAKRRDAKYCSDACKAYAYRRRINPDLYGPTVRLKLEISPRAYDILESRADVMGIDPVMFLQSNLEQRRPRTVEMEFSDADYIRLETLFTAVDNSATWGENLKRWIVNKTRGEDIASVSRTLRKR